MLRLTSMCVSRCSNQKREERNKGRTSLPFIDAFERRAHTPRGAADPPPECFNQWPTRAPHRFLTRLRTPGSGPP